MTQIYILWIALSTEKKIKIEYFRVKLIKFWWLTSQRCLNKYILTSSLQVLLIALLYVLEYNISLLPSRLSGCHATLPSSLFRG